jgi:hypothetical protein
VGNGTTVRAVLRCGAEVQVVARADDGWETSRGRASDGQHQLDWVADADVVELLVETKRIVAGGGVAWWHGRTWGVVRSVLRPDAETLTTP